jgi:hypothetical protein
MDDDLLGRVVATSAQLLLDEALTARIETDVQ